MVINGKNYTLADLRKKMPLYDIFFVEKVTSGSYQDKLDKDPIATTNPYLHMRFDKSKVVKRDLDEVADRRYTFLGQVGTKIYSCCRKFTHDDEDISRSELP